MTGEAKTRFQDRKMALGIRVGAGWSRALFPPLSPSPTPTQPSRVGLVQHRAWGPIWDPIRACLPLMTCHLDCVKQTPGPYPGIRSSGLGVDQWILPPPYPHSLGIPPPAPITLLCQVPFCVCVAPNPTPSDRNAVVIVLVGG